MRDTQESRRKEAEQMERLAAVMKVRTERDDCGDTVIQGKYGNIHVDGTGYCIYLKPRSSWRTAKAILSSMARVTKDGDREGCLHMPVIPETSECDLLRHVLHCRKLPEYTPETMEVMRQRGLALAASR